MSKAAFLGGFMHEIIRTSNVEKISWNITWRVHDGKDREKTEEHAKFFYHHWNFITIENVTYTFICFYKTFQANLGGKNI